MIQGSLGATLAVAAVFVVSLALDLRTLLPDVAYWDTGEFQTIGAVLGISHPTGYPTYTLLAWVASVVLQPFGNPAFRADMLSALLASGAAALAGLVVILVTRRAVLGLACGLALGVSRLGWEIGLAADPHALHLFLTALLLVLLVSWQQRQRTDPGRAGRWLVAAAVVFGLSLGNHALTLLLAPGIAVFLLLVDPWLPVRRWRLTLTCALALVLTTVAVYAYIPLRASMRPPLNYADPVTLERFKYLVLGEQFQGTFHALPSLQGGIQIVWEQIRQNLGLGAWLSIAGAVLGAFRHAAFVVLTGLWFLLTFVFALGYENAAIDRYYLVPLMVAAIWAALAVDAVWTAVERLIDRARLPVARLAASALVGVVLLVPVLASVPGTFDRVDRSDDAAARAWLDATLDVVEPDAVIVSWWNYSTPLWYGRWVEGRRPDVTIIDDRTVLDDGYVTAEGAIDAYLGLRPVYLIRLDRDLPQYQDRYTLERVAGIPADASGTVYRVLP
ncbi:MAG: hypothetical protein QOH61_1335 [Chloroflexota bacterium]|jgi:hypothetical protein|nr:hypothetical protein [Chloroflexota bacterium]